MRAEYDFSGAKPNPYAALCARGTRAVIDLGHGKRRVITRSAASIWRSKRYRDAWVQRIIDILSAHGRPMSVEEIVAVFRSDGMRGTEAELRWVVNRILALDGRIRKVRRVVCELA